MVPGGQVDAGGREAGDDVDGDESRATRNQADSPSPTIGHPATLKRKPAQLTRITVSVENRTATFPQARRHERRS